MNASGSNYLVVLLIVATLILLFVYSGCNVSCSLPRRSSYTFVQPPGEHRPDPGDFLPTTGNVPTGEGDMVMEGAHLSRLTTQLCEECVSHCVSWATRHGISTEMSVDHEKCFNYCQTECDPLSGL